MKNPSCLILLLFFMLPLGKARAQSAKADSLDKAVANNVANDDRKARDLFLLAAGYISSKPQKSLAYIDQILAFETSIKGRGIVASTYRIRGIVLNLLGRFPEAISNLNIALRRDRSENNDYGVAGDLSNIANIYLYQSNFPQALNYYQQAAKILNGITRYEPGIALIRKDEAANYSNIGLVYMETGDYAKAIAHFNKAIEAHQRLNNPFGIAPALSNIGLIYGKQKNYEKAVHYANRALKLSDSIGDKINYARETGNLSSYYSALGKYDQALTYGLKAVQLNKELGNTKSLGFNMQNTAAAYLYKDNLEQAKAYGLGALKIGQEIKMPEIQRDASEGLSKVYEKKKMPDSALYYYKQYALFRDSINTSKKRDEIARLSIQYEFDKKEEGYKQLKALADEQLKQQRLELALNAEQLNAGMRLRSLQAVQLQNEKLQKEEQQKQLLMAENTGKLQRIKVRELSQQQQLDQLELKQLWLYTILVVVVLSSVLLLLYNKYRIRQLRFKNTLQQQQAEQRNKELSYRSQLSESELKAVRSQMNPHFIFNVLNSIESYIMDNDRRMASRLIQKFASLSRLILENSTKSLVTADREWKALKLYTELEAMRYSHSFTYAFWVDESIKLEDLLLPPMLIQPLIENAVLHGLIIDTRSDAHLEVKLMQGKNGLHITVSDNGKGYYPQNQTQPKSSIKEKSIGIRSIRERIEMINLQYQGSKAKFEIGVGQGGRGTIATLCLPNYYPSA